MSRAPVLDLARRLAARSYPVSKRIALARLRHTTPRLVVFSMGKTGSTAVAHALHDATGEHVFQVFRLDAARLAQAEARYRANDRAAKRAGHAGGPVPFVGALHLWESEHLLAHPPTPSAPWTVVTIVREPVGQAVSAWFHGAGRRGALGAGAGAAPDVEVLAAEIAAEGWIRTPVQWLDRELAPALGVDVLDQPFDRAAGCAVVEGPAVRVLVLRREQLDAAPAALARLLGRPDPVPVPARNEASTRDYAREYRAFLDRVRFPADVVDEAYASRYARHFYALDELERLRRRWTEGAPTAAGERGGDRA